MTKTPLTHSSSAGRITPVWIFALLTGLTLTLISCGDSANLTAAVETLKTREGKVADREAASVRRDKELFEKERELAATQIQLEQQRAELELLKQSLQDEIAKLKQQQATLALRERRGPAPRVGAQRVIVFDPASDEIYYEKNADVKGQIASTQKLMTALVIAEAGGLDEFVTIAEEDCKCPPVRFGLKAGDRYTRRQLLTALMVKSSNDIAQALARDNAGSLEGFAIKMNLRAKSLGMENSYFVNPNGLPEDTQYSTARDMIQVAKAVDKIPEIREMVSLKTYVMKKPDGKEVLLENTNRVLRTMPECDGMKTGYTQAAGYCLVSSAERDGRRRISIIFNDTSFEVWRDSQALLEWALKG
jgi:serine-type D-Ala-D-Ala carboxypeptidase (penicillin-binding protein 5/6)